MKKEVFEIIKNNLETRLSLCKKYLDDVTTTEDLSNLTINQFKELKSFCKQEQIDMTEICMVDLYHVLGMGDLTVTQRNTFLKLFTEYTSYRSDLKAISMMDSIDNLPNLPSRSKYRLHKLATDVVLYSKLRGRCENNNISEDDESLETYKEAKILDKTQTVQMNSIVLQGSIINLDVTDLDTFITCLNPTGKKENLIKAARNKSPYGDVVWEFTDESETHLKGVIVSTPKRDSIRDKMKNKGLII